MKRIMVYSHDTYGLGNIRRMLEISRYLVDHDPEVQILLVSGSPMIHAFRIPARIDYVKLPCLTRTRSGSYAVKFLDMGYEDILRLRRNLLLNTFVDFDPDLLLVDKKPLGIGEELGPTLELAKRRGHRARTALVLRDVLDSPGVTTEAWRKNRYHEVIENFYDSVLVLGTPAVFDTASEYQFPVTTRAKLRYCGYLSREPGRGFREQLRRDVGVKPDERLVLVTVGGGDDGDRVLNCYLDGWRQNPQLRDRGVRTLLICGSEMNEVNRRQIICAADDPSIIVRDFDSDMMTCIGAADVVVSMGGYNTICEILSCRKPAVVIPRARPVAEQWIRAQRMAAQGYFHAIHPDEVQPTTLIEAVTEELDRAENPARHPRPQLSMRGLPNLHEAVNELTAYLTPATGTFPRLIAGLA
jgi:predicted glycosyltransferase